MEERKIEYVVCECGAICLNGHDEDGQVYCAGCGKSFRPKEVIVVDESEFHEKVRNLKKCIRVYDSWIAYK